MAEIVWIGGCEVEPVMAVLASSDLLEDALRAYFWNEELEARKHAKPQDGWLVWGGWGTTDRDDGGLDWWIDYAEDERSPVKEPKNRSGPWQTGYLVPMEIWSDA